MRNPFSFEVEPFGADSEFDEQEEERISRPCRCGQQSKVGQTYSEDREFIEEMDFDTELADFEEEGEVNRTSPDYVRWIQRSLNQVLGLRLAEDGIMGPQTRSAIQSFQRRQGLTADGIVGPNTEAALINATGGAAPKPVMTMPMDTIKPAAARLWKFDKNSAKLKDFHMPEIEKVADKVVASWKTGQPIFTIYVKGHTSVGSAYNIGLGSHRALAVRKALQKALERKQRNLSYKVLILTLSRGAKDPIVSNQTEEGRSQNRRVEIFLSTNKLLPKTPPLLPPPIPGCKEELLKVRFAACDAKFNKCTGEAEQFFIQQYSICDNNECKNRVKQAWERYLGSCIETLKKCQENAQYKAGCGPWDLSRRS